MDDPSIRDESLNVHFVLYIALPRAVLAAICLCHVNDHLSQLAAIISLLFESYERLPPLLSALSHHHPLLYNFVRKARASILEQVSPRFERDTYYLSRSKRGLVIVSPERPSPLYSNRRLLKRDFFSFHATIVWLTREPRSPSSGHRFLTHRYALTFNRGQSQYLQCAFRRRLLCLRSSQNWL